MKAFKRYPIAWTAIFVTTIALIAQPTPMHPLGYWFFGILLSGSSLTLLILGKKK